ncbi:8-amino-7-oxononanoate synthase [Thermodesulfitimonas autotrophica]|uniref:8-amino-7-oxononanoate synthase n=1 Tax=Thermodesulfitimonas autotrophica TaxID=1894989 RepID=UPI002FE222F4
MNWLQGFLHGTLEELELAHLKRQLTPLIPVGPVRALWEGQEVVLFCSNNYLGLTHDPRVIARAQEALTKYGAGSGAARLVSGHTPLHQALEEALARFKGAARALLFPTGYTANIAVLSTLVGRHDVVFCDRLCHASLLDGVLLSGAKLVRFQHNDPVSLRRLLAAHPGRRRFVVTEGVFSMEGDMAPLRELVALAEEFSLVVVVDDAHGTGTVGPGGRGALAAQGVSPEKVILTGTLSKALGSLGGFVAGPAVLIEYLTNRARPFIFTTALPPASVASAIAAIEILETEPELVERLAENTRLMREGLTALGISVPGETPILPLILGTPEKARRAQEYLLARGYYVPAIRPPTVPPGTARLRITVSAAHTKEEIAGFLAVLREALAAA